MSRILLVGNANAGKTSLFNKLTGLNQKVGNFHGVTVTYSSGFFKLKDKEIEIIDLPGSFSLNSISEDKKILTHFLIQRNENDRVLFVLDATQLERSLQFFYQVKDLGVKICLVLTMKDILEKSNIQINIENLEKSLDTKVFLVNSKTGEGIDNLKENLTKDFNFRSSKKLWTWDIKRENLIQKVLNKIDFDNPIFTEFVISNSFKKLSGESVQEQIPDFKIFNLEIQNYIQKEFKNSKLKFLYQDEVLYRANSIKKVLSNCLTFLEKKESKKTFSFDSILMHPKWGILIFLFLMIFVFQMLFSFSQIPMDFIESIFDSLTVSTKQILPEGPIQNLVTKGILTGLGSVLVFIPQIAFLFFFIGLLEETGYLSRILFLMDKFMGKFGLSGKSFLPLISSAACAVPAIMSTRTIENKSEKIITILISPLVTCSARYPVYILIISAIFPEKYFGGFLSLQGLVLFGLFILGITTALLFALIFKKVFFKKENSYFLIELPEYRIPIFKNLILYTYQNVKDFLLNSGKIIFYVSILLWFLANYPNPNYKNQIDIQDSYISRMGKTIEPTLKPLGFDWKIGVGILASFAAREVMVSTIAILYNVDEEDTNSLKEKIQNEKNEKGEKVWTLPTCLSLLIFFAFASQCFSTLAVTRKETNSYFWTAFMFFYMTLLAFLSSFVVYQTGKLFF